MNKVLSFVKDLEKGKVSAKDMAETDEKETRMEVATIPQADGRVLLITYYQDAVRLLKKICRFRYNTDAGRFEGYVDSTSKLSKFKKSLVLTEMELPRPCPHSILRKINLLVEVLHKQEAGIDKALMAQQKTKDKLKGLITEYGVHREPGLSEDAFVIYEKNQKAHSVVSVHENFINSEILKIAETHPLLKNCVTMEPMVHRQRVLEIWDQLTPAVQQRILRVNVSPPALHFHELKGKRCQTCGSKLTKNAKTQEETCKTCEKV